MNSGPAQCNATTVRPLDTRRSPVRRPKYVPNVPRKATIIGTASKKCLGAYRAADHTSHLVGIAGHSTPSDMSRTLQILQLNVRKQSMVQQSLVNDEQLRDFGVLAITEPHVWKQGDTLAIVPMGHSNWTRLIPTVQEAGRWAVRSMLWVRKDLEAEQV